MKRALPFVLLLLLLFAACDDRPQDVLSRGKMEDVLSIQDSLLSNQ